MSRTFRLRLPGVVITALTLTAIIAACGSETGSSFPDGDAGADGSQQNNSSGIIGGGNREAGTSGTSGDPIPDGSPCVGDACTPTPTSVCGDKIKEAAEECDDGNPAPGDGCSGTCTIEPGYTCPKPGDLCLYTVVQVCGNGKVEGNELCDDSNTKDADGCSAGCQVEQGFKCEVQGQACTPVIAPRCGDGALNFGEECDDKNDAVGDGCAADCKRELGWICPNPGQPCTKLEYCGDGIKQAAEECDDNNAQPGDGCSGVCKLEAGYSCTTAGQACTRIWVCGNGKVDPGESCDDSNTNATDGCSADCSFVEPGWTCPNTNGTGGACTRPPANTCGDAIVAGTEQCDDGDKDSNDGCSSACAVEPGWTCPNAGQACTRIAFCGDGKVDVALGEECDDVVATQANPVKGNDGCSIQCKLEPNYACPTPGAPCVSTVVCGDKKITGTELCDDGNKVGGDGCSSDCKTIESGWKCTLVGIACTADRCGDGKKVDNEQCDDGNTNNNDGCDSNCALESITTVNNGSTTVPPSTTIEHYTCAYTPANAPQQTCTKTVCGVGGGGKQGSEQCDDNNNAAYDGCSPSCTLEPICPNGQCQARCGDSLLTNYDLNGDNIPEEECDDGNTLDGDGCSSTCKEEPGYDCTNSAGDFPAGIDIPVVFRDFKYWNSADTTTHPDFERYGCARVSPGLVEDTLTTGVNGVPRFRWNGVGNDPSGTDTNGDCGQQLTSAADLSDWFKDIDIGGVRRSNRIDGKQLRLVRTGTAQTGYSYVFDSAVHQPWATKGGFFPIDGEGFGNQGGLGHNFAFTTELRYWFTYTAGQTAQLDFSGDDDVWVFINGRLALDVGGLHPRQDRSFTLNDTTAATLGLVNGRLYEIALFHAERHENASNFKLTLRGFVKNTSVCTNNCGDGIRTREEQCDLGSGPNGNKPPASVPYNGCTTECKLGPFCGDKVKTTPPEACDDGVNQSTYGGTTQKCNPSCQFAPYCGDGVVSNGEQCDNGTANNTGGYGKCSNACVLGPRCGDKIKDPQEQCDDGAANGSTGSACNANCTLKCGDGVKQAGEACDDGAANNTGGYGKCNPTCTLGPRCGDGLPNGTEQCDDGKNDGTYGTCNANCTLAAFCGDSVVTNPPEACDQGPNNSATAYGPNKCTNRCTPAPRCGDKAVDGPNGELCDDGKNDGTPGSCSADCKQFIPLISCGNGTVNAPEQCDDGAAVNGTAGSACDTHCRFKCGNGVKDPGETCDNGVNDGSYGGCTPTCGVAGFCGDSTKNGPEQCDNGPGNLPLASTYGPNKCTTACTFAPYCGDGRVQSQFGEECDGSPTCSSTCKDTGPK